MFSNLEDIKKHCDQVFPDKPPLKVESSILASPIGERSYQIKIYLMAPDIPELVRALRDRLEEIKGYAANAGFETESAYGKVQPVGYHFELTVRNKQPPSKPK